MGHRRFDRAGARYPRLITRHRSGPDFDTFTGSGSICNSLLLADSSLQIPAFDLLLFGGFCLCKMSGVTSAILSQFERDKHEAAAAQLADGAEMVTSFTSDQPMHGWTIDHALRELWQNLRDGVMRIIGAGHKFQVKYEGDHSGRIRLEVYGHEFAYVDLSVPDQLVLRQSYTVLQPKHLTLASSKDDARFAGCHGEGFKVAVNFLHQKGYKVAYKMNGATWDFCHRPVYSPTVKNLVVTIRRASEYDHLRIVITGPGAHNLFDRKIDWDLMRTKEATPGELSMSVHAQELVITSNARVLGRVYNRGLFVNHSDELADLGLCVNLNLDLHRDRHALPANLPRKFADLLQQAMSVAASNPAMVSSVTALCEHLMSRFKLSHTRDHVYAPALRDTLRSYCAQKMGVDKDSIVFVSQGSESRDIDFGLLRALGLVAIPDAGALADGTDLDRLCLARLRVKLPYSPVNDTERMSLEYLRKLFAAMALHGVDEGLKIVDLGSTVACRISKTTVYLGAAALRSEKAFHMATLLTYSCVTQCYSETVKGDLAAVLREFQLDPAGFTPALHGPPTPAALGAAAAAQAGGAWASMSAAGGILGADTGARQPASCAEMSLQADGPSARLSQPHLPHSSTVPTNIPGIDSLNGAVAVPVSCRIPCAQLVPLTCDLGGGRSVAVYVDSGILATPLFQSQLGELGRRLAYFHPKLEQLRYEITQTLRLQPFPIVYTVCNGAKGFNYHGLIYINISPIVNVGASVAAVDAAGEAFLHTLLHEIAHWSHARHDEGFAEELAKLMWRCRRVFG